MWPLVFSFIHLSQLQVALSVFSELGATTQRISELNGHGHTTFRGTLDVEEGVYQNRLETNP